MISGASRFRPGDQVIITAHGQICFYCYGATEDPTIIWVGSTGEIFLHPACAAELIIRLIRDVHELECAANLRLQLVPHNSEGER